MAEAVSNRHPSFDLVFAGGLGPGSMHLVKDLATMFPDLSIDAQAGLRKNRDILEPIDWNMARDTLSRH